MLPSAHNPAHSLVALAPSSTLLALFLHRLPRFLWSPMTPLMCRVLLFHIQRQHAVVFRPCTLSPRQSSVATGSIFQHLDGKAKLGRLVAHQQQWTLSLGRRAHHRVDHVANRALSLSLVMVLLPLSRNCCCPFSKCGHLHHWLLFLLSHDVARAPVLGSTKVPAFRSSCASRF